MGWFSNLFKKKKKQTTTEVNLTLTYYEIQSKFLRIWPNLDTSVLHLSDGTYFMPTRDDVLVFIMDSTVNDYLHTYYSNSPESGIFDCDDFSILLHSEVIEKRYKELMSGKIPEGEKFPLAFGQIWYSDKKLGSHAVNICITSDKGIVFIEPQLGKISPAEKDCKISFIRM